MPLSIKNLKFQLVIAILFFSSLISAQIGISITGGSNISSIYGNQRLSPMQRQHFGEAEISKDQYQKKFRLLWSFGVAFSKSISEKWVGSLGLNYSTRGYKVLHDLDAKKKTFTIKADYRERLLLHYLDIPLIGSYKFKDDLRFLVGLQPSFKLGSKIKSEQIISYHDRSDNLITKETFSSFVSTELKSLRRFDLCILTGTEYRITPKLRAGLLGCIGTRKIYKEHLTTRLFVLTVYLKLNLYNYDEI